MSKKAKIELTPEELADKKIRRSNGWTRFWAIVVAFALTAGVFGVAKSQGAKASAEKETTTAASSSSSASSASSSSSWDDGSDSSSSSASSSSSSSASSDAASSDASSSTDAEAIATAINTATAKVANEKAGYNWVRNCNYTTPIDVGNATDTLNKVIHMVDENADLNSVVGGFLGVGDKEIQIAKGEDAAEKIDYHGTNYAIKATKLKGADLKNLKVDGDTYTFTLEDTTSPQKDDSTSLSRFTNDIVVQSEVDSEIKANVSVVSVSSLEAKYTGCKVSVTIKDGKLEAMSYSTDASAVLVLKALGIPITGSGAIHTDAKYSNFVY